MGRRYLLSDRVQIVLGTGAGRFSPNILKDHLGLPCPCRRCRADVREVKGGGEVADYVARLDQE